jgi:hypothetical protein
MAEQRQIQDLNFKFNANLLEDLKVPSIIYALHLHYWLLVILLKLSGHVIPLLETLCHSLRGNMKAHMASRALHILAFMPSVLHPCSSLQLHWPTSPGFPCLEYSSFKQLHG